MNVELQIANRIKRHVYHPFLVLVGEQRKANRLFWVELVIERLEALRADVRFCLDFHRDGIHSYLQKEILFKGRLIRAVVIWCIRGLAYNLLQDKLFCQGSLELDKQTVCGEGPPFSFSQKRISGFPWRAAWGYYPRPHFFVSKINNSLHFFVAKSWFCTHFFRA